jgi:hypothetical protein
LRITVFLPVLLSGRKNAARLKSTYSHFSVKISPSRQPVRMSSRIAAALIY